MELPSALFEAVTGCDPSQLAPVADNDRRRACRLPLLSRASMYPCEEAFGESVVVFVHDVSVLGVGFIHRQALRISQEFILQMPCQRGANIRLKCRVERCQPSGNRYFIGASFTSLLHAPAIRSTESHAVV